MARAAATTTRSTTRSRASTSTKKTAQKKTKQTAENAQEQASELQSQASSVVSKQLSERASHLSGQLTGTASDIREIGQHLRNQDNPAAAHVADLAAQRVDDVGSYLSGKSGDELLNDLEELARRRPWLAAAGAAVAGFGIARVLSSSQRARATQ
jgi:hypothetical protein